MLHPFGQSCPREAVWGLLAFFGRELVENSLDRLFVVLAVFFWFRRGLARKLLRYRRRERLFQRLQDRELARQRLGRRESRRRKLQDFRVCL